RGVHWRGRDGRTVHRKVGDRDELPGTSTSLEREPVTALRALVPGFALGAHLGREAGAQLEEGKSDADGERASQHRAPSVPAFHRRSAPDPVVVHRLVRTPPRVTSAWGPARILREYPRHVKTHSAAGRPRRRD